MLILADNSVLNTSRDHDVEACLGQSEFGIQAIVLNEFFYWYAFDILALQLVDKILVQIVLIILFGNDNSAFNQSNVSLGNGHVV